jgi:hypothetical protein
MVNIDRFRKVNGRRSGASLYCGANAGYAGTGARAISRHFQRVGRAVAGGTIPSFFNLRPEGALGGNRAGQTPEISISGVCVLPRVVERSAQRPEVQDADDEREFRCFR